MDKDAIAHAIEGLPDTRTLLDRTATFRSVNRRMEQENEALTAQYPNQWVAVGQDGLISHGESAQAVAEYVNGLGFHNWEYALKFLDPDHPVLIL